MAKARAMVSAIGMCVLLSLAAISTAELAPVFMWETASTNEVVPSIGHINQATFKEILMAKIEKSNPFIVVYAENNLSPEDFIEQDGEVFRHMSKLSDKNRVTYMPLVESPVETIKDLPANNIAEVSIEELLTNKIPDAKVLTVNLNDARDDENRVDMLRRHDAIIAKSYNDLMKEHEEILAIFTGYHSSWIVPEDIKNHRVARATKDETPAAADDKYIVITQENFLFYLSNTDVEVTGTENRNLIIESGERVNNSVTLKTNGTDILFEFETLLGYWYLRNVTYGDLTISSKIYAPEGFSYHCGDTSLKFNGTSLKFRGLQMQFMGINNQSGNLTKFSEPYDCVGFTTAPIWSGLFITFILVLIMTLGLTMMMDIKTMDRFDDPKGKTIIINASE